MKRTLPIIAALALLLSCTLRAQVDGTLTGKVTDGESGKPLAGVRVTAMDAGRTAFTKGDGSYLISGLRAGQHRIRFSFTGYRTDTALVSISANQTSRLDKSLYSSSFVTPDIPVYGSRIPHDDPVVIIPVDPRQIEQRVGNGTLASALRDYTQAAGQNGPSIRGGRDHDTRFLVDGVDISDRFTGGLAGSMPVAFAPTISTLGLQQIQIGSSTIDPQFNAFSGSVNTVQKVGSKNIYELILKYRTNVGALYGSSSPITVANPDGNGDTTMPGAQLASNGRQNFDFGFGGPVPGTDGKATFFISGNTQYLPYSGANYHVYDMSPQYAQARHDVAMKAWGYALQPLDLGQLAHQNVLVRNLAAKVRMNLDDNLAFEAGGEAGRTSREVGGWGNAYMLDHPVFYRTENGQTVADTNFSVLERDAQQISQNLNINRLSLRATYAFSSTSLLDLSASYVGSRSETGKKDETKKYGLFQSYDIYPLQDADGDKIIDRYYAPQTELKLNNLLDPTIATQSVPGRNALTGLYEEGETGGASRNPFGLNGLTFPTHGNSRNLELRQYTALTVKGAYENILAIDSSTRIDLKTGFEFNHTTLSLHSNSLPWDPNPFFDVYGESSSYFNDDPTGKLAAFFAKPFTPIDGAVYANTVVHYKNSLTLSAGARFDFYATGVQVAPLQRNTLEQVVQALDTAQNASVKFQISPRIGVSYPVTDNSNFRVSFSVLFKRPEYNLMFDNIYGSAARGNQIFGNPDIRPEKSVNYEIGYSALLDKEFGVDVTAFYRDIYNQSGISYMPVLPSPYSMYSTQEYGNVRGLELSLRRSLADNFRAELNYTLQQARGTASSPTSNYSTVVTGARDEFTGEKQQFPLTEYPLDYDQTHRANGNLSMVWGDNEGPAIGGLRLLQNTVISLGASFETGLPYTREDTKGKPVTEFNSLRLPAVFNTEAHLERTFKLGKLLGSMFGQTELTFFADISNLLNTTGPVSVRFSRVVGSSRFSVTGSPDVAGQELKVGDFTATPYYRDLDPNRPATWGTDQYDRFGTRYYNPYSDINLDGVVTQLEKFESYKRYLTTVQMLRGAYQAPRTVAVGVRLQF